MTDLDLFTFGCIVLIVVGARGRRSHGDRPTEGSPFAPPTPDRSADASNPLEVG